MKENNLSRMVAFYEEGGVPWDQELPPPEVEDVVKKLKVGGALDLGCGFGRASRYLADHGWTVDAIDFVPQAIEEARHRSHEYTAITYHHASVLELDFLESRYEFILDVGCGHSLKTSLLSSYINSVEGLLKQDGLFLLYGRLREGKIDEADVDRSGPRGFDLGALMSSFSAEFTLEKMEQGETTVGEDTWRSAWFWWRRA